MPATDVRDTSAWAPFRRKVFRALWIAQFVSNVGTWMQSVGAVWVMVELKGSPTQIALVQTATTLPVVFFGIAGGALADLMDRRRVLLATQSLMLVAAAALALLDGVGAVSTVSLLGLTFALGVGTALNNPAWQAIQPELVPRDEFAQAVTLGGASINLGRAIGPALGGLLVAAAGPWLVFSLNALSFSAVIAVLVRWHRPPDDVEGPPERFAGAVRAGTRYAFFSHALAGVLIRAGLFSAAGAGLMALLPVYSTAVLALGSGGFGLLLAGFGIGAIVAAAFLPALRARLDEDAVVTAGTLAFAAVLVALAVVDTTAVALALVVVAGGAWLLCLSTFNVASQQALPGWVRARGLALYLSVFSGGIALGSLVWGVDTPARAALEAANHRRARSVARAHVRTGDAPGSRGHDRSRVRHAHLRRAPGCAPAVPRGARSRAAGATPDGSRRVGGVSGRRSPGPVHRDVRRADLGRAPAPARAPDRQRPADPGRPPSLPPRQRAAPRQALRRSVATRPVIIDHSRSPFAFSIDTRRRMLGHVRDSLQLEVHLMPIVDSVLVVGFKENSKAYEGFSTLKSLSDEGKVTARSAAVVERDDAGKLDIKDSFDNETGVPTVGGGFMGMLLGVIGGPVGMILGLTGGALAGGSFDLRRADQQDDVLTQINAAINPGHTVLVAQVNEPTVEVLDKAMGDLDGVVMRRSEADVVTELDAAEDAARDAQVAAQKAVMNKKMADINEKREDRIAALKAKFSRHHDEAEQGSG